MASVAGSPDAYPLVGRDRELAALEELLAAGRSALAVVCGPVGMGKSKLLREVARRAREGGWDVMQVEVQRDTTVEVVASWAASAAPPLLLVADGWRPRRELREWLDRERARRAADDAPIVVLIGDEERAISDLRASATLWLELEPLPAHAVRGHLEAAGRGLYPPLSDAELAVYTDGVRERPELLRPLARVLRTTAETTTELGAAP